MRISAFVLAIAFSATGAASSVADEFARGFGGVPWGMSITSLVEHFPGGFEAFSTAPGRISYALNIDDPVLGIARRGEHVLYSIGTDGTVDAIEVQVPYEQTATLISTVKAKFGPEKSVEIKGFVTIYRWPNEKQFGLFVRTTNSRMYGLTTLSITNLRPVSAPGQVGGKTG